MEDERRESTRRGNWFGDLGEILRPIRIEGEFEAPDAPANIY